MEVGVGGGHHYHAHNTRLEGLLKCKTIDNMQIILFTEIIWFLLLLYPQECVMYDYSYQRRQGI